jgi:hypothetical protein
MRATGHSSEEISAALAFFLNCPAVNPDENGTEVNVDEFEHTEVEQQARRDQQRVLTALVRRNQQHVPGADVEHFGLQGPVGCASRAMLREAVDFCVATSPVTDSVTASPVEQAKRREHRRDPEVQREGNDVIQAAFQSPTAHDDATAGSPPTHPAQLSDGGGSDVGGVGSHQTQDIVTETSPSTASQASTTLAAGAMVPSAEDSAMLLHQRYPLRIAGDTWTRQRALEYREYRSRFSDERAADPPREAEGHVITRTDGHVITRTPEEEKAECEEWNTRRYGETFHLVREMDSDDLIADGFASYHATTGSDGYETAAPKTHTRRSTSSLQKVIRDTMAPTAGEIEAPPAHLGAYHDTPLDVSTIEFR